MSLSPHSSSKTTGPLAAAVLVVALMVAAKMEPACAQVQPPAAEGTAASRESGFDGVLRALNLKSAPTTPAEFVAKTRPDESSLTYLPVGKAHPVRPIKTLTPAEVAATEADLDAARIDQQRRAGLKPAAVPLKVKTQTGTVPPATKR